MNEVGDDFADSFSDLTSPMGFISTNGTATGRIEFGGDRDIFAVTLAAGQAYTFNLNGTTLSDPYLRLIASSSAQLASNDDANGGLNSQISFAAST